MDRTALLDLLDGLASDRAAGLNSGTRLVNACVDVLDVTGAGIMLIVDDEQQGTLGGSDRASEIVEELQFSLGEGPCVDCHRSGRPVSEPHLANPAVVRWPEFTGPALDAGIEAIFGFPLHVGPIRLGALDLYSNRPGRLSARQFDDALVLSAVVANAVLELQATAAPGELPGEIDERPSARAVVHQASGMVSAQLDLSVADALRRLRAHAYAEGRPLSEVARAVVGRELTLE